MNGKSGLSLAIGFLLFVHLFILLVGRSVSSETITLNCEWIECKEDQLVKKCSCGQVNASDGVYAADGKLKFNHTSAEIKIGFHSPLPADAALTSVMLALEWRIEDSDPASECEISVWQPVQQPVNGTCVYEEKSYRYDLSQWITDISQLANLTIKAEFENLHGATKRVYLDHAYVEVGYKLPVKLQLSIFNQTAAVGNITILSDGETTSCASPCSANLTPGENYTLILHTPGVTVTLEHVNITSATNLTAQSVANYTAARPTYVTNLTSVFALNDSQLVYGGAQLHFEKRGWLNKILYCTHWDWSAAACQVWQVGNWWEWDAEQNATHLWFRVSRFTAFAGGAGYNANLTTWDDTDPEGGLVGRLKGETVRFFANYTNATDGQPINTTTDYCEISFNVTGSWTAWQNMTFNSTSRLYEYGRSFAYAGIRRWNVTCRSLTYDDLNTSDTVLISVRVPTACEDSDSDCDYTHLYADDGTAEGVNLKTDPFGWINASSWNWDLPQQLIINSTLHIQWWSDTGLGAGDIYIDYWNSTDWLSCAGPFGEQASETETVCDISQLTVAQQNSLMVRFRGEDLDLALPAFAYVDFVYVMADVDEPPTWSGNVTAPPSPTTYSPGASYQFNLTWQDNVGVDEVVFEWAGANYSYLAGQLDREGDVWYKQLVDLAAGTYAYRWYANDTADLWNVSDTWSYVISKAASSVQVSLSPAATVTYPTTTTATCSIVTGDVGATLSLYRNGTLVAQGSGSQTDTILLGGGVYNYTCVYQESENYTTSASLDNLLTVQPGPTQISLWLNGTRGDTTYLRGQLANLSAQLNVSGKTLYLWANFTGVEEQIGSAVDYVENLTSTGGLLGTYLVKANWTGDVNYTADAEAWTLAVIYFEVSLAEPPLSLMVPQNMSFTLNATLICRGAKCGNVEGEARYNATSSQPDTAIPTSQATPFYLLSPAQNPLACPTNPLEPDEFCNVTWQVNATGAIDSVWRVGVFFTSDLIVGGNHTANSTITIVCPIYMVLQFTLIDFGSIDPFAYSPALGNDDLLYNVTVTQQTGCNVDLWIRGEDLQQVDGPYSIQVGNLTWNTTDVYPGINLTYSYDLIRSGVPPATNVTTYYWLDVPGGIAAGGYNATIWYLANETV